MATELEDSLARLSQRQSGRIRMLEGQRDALLEALKKGEFHLRPSVTVDANAVRDELGALFRAAIVRVEVEAAHP